MENNQCICIKDYVCNPSWEDLPLRLVKKNQNQIGFLDHLIVFLDSFRDLAQA